MSHRGPVPVPDGLAIEWEQPEDPQLFWTIDRMHFPAPISSIDDELIRNINERGMNHSFEMYDVPMRAHARRFWTYHYSAFAPLMLSEDEMHAMGKRSEEKLVQAVGQLGERWEGQWLPEVQSHIAFWNQFPLGDASMPDLLQHLAETRERLGRLWEIHFSVAFPMMLAVHLFDEMYQDLFKPDSPLRAYQLIQGFDNKTLESDRELWKLSRTALTMPEVRSVLEESAADDVIPALERTEEGRSFLADLRAYLDEYGQRGDTWGISNATWIELPTPVIKNLKDYVAQPDRDPELELAATIAERDQLIAEAHERLQGYPESVRDQFGFLLKAAQTGIVLTEDHGFWIDFRSTAAARKVFLEFGRRFAAAGMIDVPADIFHLTVDEIVETAELLPTVDRRSLVEQRKAEIERYSVIQPPPAIGTPPPGPPPDNPMTRMMGKFFGTPPVPSEQPGTLTGSAGSAGVARGTARVVRSLADAARIRPGDILVAETTAPPWTPLFASVAAVVTDTGGILSHCAVVAREYRIPAVVGTGIATAMIVDGQTIEVDGNQGIVRIIGFEEVAPDAVSDVAPGPIPVPDNFPVVWEDPDDERAFWMVERMHWPDPMTPMDFEFMRDAHHQFTWALEQYGVPLQYVPRHINYRWYHSIMPNVADPSEIPARMEAGIKAIMETIPLLQELWSAEWLPEVQEHLTFWREFDLENATMQELLSHHEETLTRHNRVWRIHFLQTFPVYMAMSTFDDLYQDLFGSQSSLDAYRLMQGFENHTVEIGRALWQLSRKALSSPIVRAATEGRDPASVIPALEQSAEGRAFLTDLRAFLEEYGQRGEKLGVSFTSWIEDPAHAIRHLQEYVRQPDLDFEAENAKLATARERLLADARATLSGYPRTVAEQFDAMLRHAQQATRISEDHTLYIDFGAMYQVRCVLLEFGRRFVEASVIEDVSDVFLLKREELRETAENLPQGDQRATIAARRAEMEHFRLIAPPPALGTPPAGPHPDDPLSRTVGKFFGAPPPAPDSASDGRVIVGGSGSSGKVVGTARVISSLSEAGRLQAGDILVTATTSPAWTPLFASVAAVVTDTGGVLSHCAVVAREYGIPAVVGTGTATVRIVEGQTIEVDGDHGIVRIIG
jgi:phosphohistidine swiveling domain-containing protein